MSDALDRYHYLRTPEGAAEVLRLRTEEINEYLDAIGVPAHWRRPHWENRILRRQYEK